MMASVLQNFAGRKIRHLGIEPSANVAEVARQKGIETVSEFFDETLARRIVSEHGQADAFLAANDHVPHPLPALGHRGNQGPPEAGGHRHV